LAEWYYIGHYGQLGPLTRDQIDDLIQGGVITRETYIWRSGMAQWQHADAVAELQDTFRSADPFVAPPPPPTPATPSGPPSPYARPYGSDAHMTPAYGGHFPAIKSDRSRILAGILQLILPGVGRLYLGYAAYGVLQIVATILSCTILWLWSFIDGLIILSGGLKMDGYGRVLSD
jgi:hypothetical protein